MKKKKVIMIILLLTLLVLVAGVVIAERVRCDVCDGVGRITCTVCGGRKRIPVPGSPAGRDCPNCSDGTEVCWKCLGAKYVDKPDPPNPNEHTYNFNLNLQ